MSRIQKLLSYADHPWHGKQMKKLSKDEFQACIAFIREHDSLDKNAFAEKANRWMLDTTRPKNYSLMWSFVIQSNA